MKTKELECILKLVNLDFYEELKEYIIDNKLAKESDFKELYRDFERAGFIYTTLKAAEENEDLILLDFEWVFLPKHYIKLMCVTETEKKVFSHGI